MQHCLVNRLQFFCKQQLVVLLQHKLPASTGNEWQKKKKLISERQRKYRNCRTIINICNIYSLFLKIILSNKMLWWEGYLKICFNCYKCILYHSLSLIPHTLENVRLVFSENLILCKFFLFNQSRFKIELNILMMAELKMN